jgi:hypothetical protein
MAEQSSDDFQEPYLVFQVGGSAGIGGEPVGIERTSEAWVRAMASVERQISAAIANRVTSSEAIRRLLADGEVFARCSLTFAAGSLNYGGTVKLFGRPSASIESAAASGAAKLLVEHLNDVVSDATNAEIAQFARHLERSDRLLADHPLHQPKTFSFPDHRSPGFKRLSPAQPVDSAGIFPSHINIHHHERELPGLFTAIERLTLQIDRLVDSTSRQSERMMDEALARYDKRQRTQDRMMKWLLVGLLAFGVLAFSALNAGRLWNQN